MQLTKAEEQVMHFLWNSGEATVQAIREQFHEPKPARTTIATILNILENKQFAGHYTKGRINIYRPLISKEEYSKKQFFGFLKNYFDGSFSSLTSFFAKETNMTVEELDKLMQETKANLQEVDSIYKKENEK
ncbi:MAG: BlaI/MecI/CopY family transcriptional regulator [Candidatus Azobacteroides sp.]|nr:BlaI/MecI/CopY family transcriptional regulator [Candidatus Azobacteroides sp.]